MTAAPEAVPADLVPGSVLADTDAAISAAKVRAMRAREAARAHNLRAVAEEQDAEDAARRAKHLQFARTYLEARIGRTWAEVLAEAEADLEKVTAELAEAEKSLNDNQEHVRDLQGYIRILRQQAQEGAVAADGELPATDLLSVASQQPR